MIDLSASERIIVGTLLEQWPTPKEPYLTELVLIAPIPFIDRRAGQLVRLLKQRHDKHETTHIEAIREVAFAKGIIDLQDLQWFANVSASGLIIDHAEMEAECLLRNFRNRQFIEECNHLAKMAEASPESIATSARALLLSAENILDPTHRNGAPTFSPAPAWTPEAFPELPDSHPDELFKSNYIKRGNAFMLVATSGIGKSTFIFQAAMLWALGEPAFGIIPTKPLSILIVQAENDAAELGRFRGCLTRGLKFTKENLEAFAKRIHVHTHKQYSGQSFINHVLEPALAHHKPDLLIIDPALHYLGGPVNDQEYSAFFLRQGLDPLLEKHHCACLINHHAPKPIRLQGNNPPPDQDLAYLGAGSAEWTNWPRAILALLHTDTPGVFRLLAAKRYKELGWRDRYIAYAQDGIYWTEPSSDQLAEVELTKPRPLSPQAVLSLLPPTGLSFTAWKKMAHEVLKCPKTTFQRYLDHFQKLNLIQKYTHSEHWFPSKSAFTSISDCNN